MKGDWLGTLFALISMVNVKVTEPCSGSIRVNSNEELAAPLSDHMRSSHHQLFSRSKPPPRYQSAMQLYA